MRYYYSDLHTVKVRVDEQSDAAYARLEGQPEYELERYADGKCTKIEADAVIANKQITKDEYYSDEGFD